MATLAAALLLGLGTAAAQERTGEGDAAQKPQGGSSWLTWWWPFGRKAEPPKTPPRTEARAPSAVESAMALRKREETAWLRRQAVCLRLLEIADRTHDAELRRQAEELEELARDTYLMRTGHLPALSESAGPDEQALMRRAGPGPERPDAALLSGSSTERDGGRLAERRDR
jgi:hypothetical protein